MNHDKIREILFKLIEKGWSIGNLAPYGTRACQFSSTLSGDVNEALAAITSELEKSAPRWVSVEDRLPDPHKQVLTYAGWVGIDILFGGKFGYTGVTHWRPLPKAPGGVNES